MFSGVIQVLGRARKWKVCRESQAEMVSAFLTADFHSRLPPPVLQNQYCWRMMDSRDWLGYRLKQCFSGEGFFVLMI